MTGALKPIGALCLTATLALTGCGNSEDKPPALSAAKSLIQAFKPRPKPEPLSPQQIGAALTATDKSVILINFETTKNQGLMLHIESNGAYRTYGTSNRTSLTMQNGMVTASRGLGDDLMSSDARALMALVSSRSNGSAPYTVRHLDGKDEILARSYTCEVTAGASVPVAGGLIDTTATTMTAACTGAEPAITNVYLVEKGGRILGGRQWMSPKIAYMSYQFLRR